MQIVADAKFPAPLEFWGWVPFRIGAEDRIQKLETSQVMQLRYVAMEFLSGVFLTWEDCELTRDEIEDHAAVQGGMLYLNDFEGYRLGESLQVHYLYLNTDGRACAAVYDETTDEYTYWCIY